MRIWLDPQETLCPRADTVRRHQGDPAARDQQVTGGQVGTPPAPDNQDFQYTVNVEGRLSDPAEFGDIIVKGGGTNGGQITRVKDIARVELGAHDLFGGVSA